MPIDHSIARKLFAEKIIPSDLLESYRKARDMKEISPDVAAILTHEQCATLAQQRVELCRLFQKQLEDFFKKHYYRHYSEKRTLRPIDTADAHVSHDGNRTLWYVEEMLKENKSREALDHIGRLPGKFAEIYNLYVGNTDLDIRGYFPQLFPEAKPIPERQ